MPIDDYGQFWFRGTSRFQPLAAGATTILTLNANDTRVELWSLDVSCDQVARVLLQALPATDIGGGGTAVLEEQLDRAATLRPIGRVLAGSNGNVITLANERIIIPLHVGAYGSWREAGVDRPLLILDTTDAVAVTLVPVAAGAFGAATFEWREPNRTA